MIRGWNTIRKVQLSECLNLTLLWPIINKDLLIIGNKRKKIERMNKTRDV